MKISFKNYAIPFLSLLALLAVWEAVSRFNEHLVFVLPAPSLILLRLWEYAPRFRIHTWVTFKEMLAGIAFAFVVSVPLAWLMASWRNLRLILQPLFILTQCVPMFALAPLMVLWFGWTMTAIVVPTALMIFFPLTMSLYRGLLATPQPLIDYFKVNQATTLQIFYKLQVPYAMPYLFSGLRVAAGVAGIGAIAGEWAGAQQGLGVLMLESRRGADLEVTFGALLCLTLLTLFTYGALLLMEHFVLVRRFRFKSAQVILSCALLLCLLTGCSQKESSINKPTRLVLDWFPNPNHIVLYAGIDKGFFASESIALEVLRITDASDAIPLLTSKQTDLAISYAPHTIEANRRGAKVVIVGTLIGQSLGGFIFRSDSGIQEPKDLNGRVIGTSLDNTTRATLLGIFSDYGITAGEIRNVGFDLVTSLGMKQVDVIYGAYWNIECEHLRSYDVDTNYFTLMDLGVPNHPELLVLANEGSKESQKEFAERFQNALDASIQWCIAHPQEAFELYQKANPDKSQKTLAWEYSAWQKTLALLPRSQTLEPEVWELYNQWYDKHRQLNLEKGSHDSKSNSS